MDNTKDLRLAVLIDADNIPHRLIGGILEEISSTHFVNDSFYTDKKIALNKNRKTFVTFWQGVNTAGIN